MPQLTEQQVKELMFGEDVAEHTNVEGENLAPESISEVETDEVESSEPSVQVEQLPSAETSDAELEAFAQKQGWNPSYKGKNALTAKEYLAKSETEVPVMRDTIRRMADQMEQMQKAFERQRELDSKKYKKELEVRLQEISQEKQKLKEVGLYDQSDFDKFEKVNQAELEIKRELEESGVPARNELPLGHQRALESWISRNNWYNTDIELTYEAEQRIPIINKIHPNASPDEKLRILEDHIKNKFPDNFKSKKLTTTKVEVTERGNNIASPSQKSTKFTYSDLTPEDKVHFQTFRRTGWGLKKTSNMSSSDFDKKIQETEQQTLQDFYEDYKSRGLLK